MRGTARETRQSRRPFVPAAVLIAEAQQEMTEEAQEWDEYLFEEWDDWDDMSSDNYGDFDEDFPPVFADEHFDDCDEDWGEFDEPMDYGSEWDYELPLIAEPNPEPFFLLDPIGSGDPELLRQHRAEQEAARFIELLSEIAMLIQVLELMAAMEDLTFWQSLGGYEFEVSERSGYTGWYRYSHGRLPSGLMPEWNANTGEVRYRR